MSKPKIFISWCVETSSWDVFTDIQAKERKLDIHEFIEIPHTNLYVDADAFRKLLS